MSHNHNKAWIIRLVLAISIAISIGLMYYTTMVQRDYLIFTNPDGPEQETN